MVYVNRHEMDKKDLASIFLQFDAVLGTLNQAGVSTLFNELLGHEERITLAKRLVAIILLHEGMSEYKTARVLKLSPTTTGKLAHELSLGTYIGTIALLRKNKRTYGTILNTIDSVLHLDGILPHYCGLERYRNLNKYSS